MKIIIGPQVRTSFKGGVDRVVKDTMFCYDRHINTRYWDKVLNSRGLGSITSLINLFFSIIRYTFKGSSFYYHSGAGIGLLKDLIVLNFISLVSRKTTFFHIHFSDLDFILKWSKLFFLPRKFGVVFVVMSDSVALRLSNCLGIKTQVLLNYTKVTPVIRVDTNYWQNWLYVGSIDQRKNVFGILKLFQDAPSCVNLNIVGSSEDKFYIDRCMKFASTLDCNVYFRGYLSGNELEAMYKSNDNFIMLSKAEGLPLSLLDAAAHGLTIYTSDVGSIKEIFSDTVNFVTGDSKLNFRKSRSHRKEELFDLMKSLNFDQYIISLRNLLE